MLSSSKLRRIKNREERKAEKEKNLLSLKQSTLPVFEPRTRTQSSKCSNCKKRQESYGINFEWLLEPIDVLRENRQGFFSRHEAMRKILSCIMRALVVEPAQIKIIKFLQEHKPNVPVVLVLKSSNLKLDQCLIKFIFESFELKIPEIASSEDSIKKALISGHGILISDNSHIDVVYSAMESQEIYLLPVSVAYEIKDSTYIFQKVKTGYGLVKVSFHEPYTYDDFSQRQIPNEKFVRDHIYHDIVLKAPIMAPDLIAFLLLTHFNKGAKIEEITAKVEEIRKMNTMDFAFEGKSDDVVEHSVEILKQHITIDNEGIITPKDDKIEDLKDYARVLLYQHALESVILSTAMYLKSIDPFVDYAKMMNYAADLSDVLVDKIPFKGCVSIHDQLIEAFDNLAINDLLKKHTVIYSEKEQRAQKMAKYFDDDYGDSFGDESETEEEEELDPNNQVIINIDKQKEINILKDIILLIQGNDMAESDNEI